MILKTVAHARGVCDSNTPLACSTILLGAPSLFRSSSMSVLMFGTVMVLISSICSAEPYQSSDTLQRGDPVPALKTKSIDGVDINTEDLRGQAIVLVFGQSNHDKTSLGLREISAVLGDPQLIDETINWFLVLTKGSDISDPLPDGIIPDARSPLIIHDSDRSIAGAYNIIALPTVIVIDRDGKFVHSITGYSNRLADQVLDSILFAFGKLTETEFEQSLQPLPVTLADKEQLNAARMMHLADRMVSLDMNETAEAKYLQVLELAPEMHAAHRALGFLYVNHRRLDDAEVQFRLLLKVEPESSEAIFGLAVVYCLRGGDAIEKAEELVKTLPNDHISKAREAYIRGLIAEQRGQASDACASFRQAATTLLLNPGH